MLGKPAEPAPSDFLDRHFGADLRDFGQFKNGAIDQRPEGQQFPNGLRLRRQIVARLLPHQLQDPLHTGNQLPLDLLDRRPFNGDRNIPDRARLFPGRETNHLLRRHRSTSRDQ